MRPMIDVFPSVLGMLIYITALVLIILQFAVLLHSVQERNREKRFFSAAVFFLSALLFSV